MQRTTITYLDPKADERHIGYNDIYVMPVAGVVTFDGPFARFLDKKDNVVKYYSHTRILQTDVFLDPEERMAAIKQFGTNGKSVVYYHKIEMDGNYPTNLRNIGDKPFGFECVVAEIGDFFTTVFTPLFHSKIIIPTMKIIGMNLPNLIEVKAVSVKVNG